jgi:hypothetical protein
VELLWRRPGGLLETVPARCLIPEGAPPTLVLTNSGEDLFAASARASASRPDWRFAALDGGTHDIVDEQSEAWAAAVIDFLAAPAPDKA